jgi:hypothetical protein
LENVVSGGYRETLLPHTMPHRAASKEPAARPSHRARHRIDRYSRNSLADLFDEVVAGSGQYAGVLAAAAD